MQRSGIAARQEGCGADARAGGGGATSKYCARSESSAEETTSMSAIAQMVPDARGRYGRYGGRYVPGTLVAPLEELERAYAAARADNKFQAELDSLLRNF